MSRRGASCSNGVLMGGGFEVVGEDVASEVTVEFAPDGVDVIFAYGGDAVFDHEFGTFRAVVHFFLALGAADPTEADVAPAAAIYFFDAEVCEILGNVVDVFHDEGFEHILLLFVEVAVPDAFVGFEVVDFDVVAAEDVVGHFVCDDCGFFLIGIEGQEEIASLVLFVVQDVPAFAGSFGDFVGLGAEVGGAGGNDFAVEYAEGEVEVMSVYTDGPGRAGQGGSEDCEVVVFGAVEVWGFAGCCELHFYEVFFERDDGGGFVIAGAAEACAHDGVEEGDLTLFHFFEFQAVGSPGNDGEISPFFAADLEKGFGLLFFGEGVHEALRGEGQEFGGIVLGVEVLCG